MPSAPLRVAIAARVVDNFGDAGVAWRLARQLAVEHAAEVVLWIDAPEVLARLVPALAGATTVDGVRVRTLPARGAPAPPLLPWPTLLVEAFGCGLPEAWLDAMESAAAAPVWVNLEYLSAEAWVDGAHGLPSPQPARRLTRWFFYPGFTAHTGGLLRERGLEHLPRDRAAAWADAGLPPPPPEALAVSLFCYPTPAVQALLNAWSLEPSPVHVLVPEGVAREALVAFLGTAPREGRVHVRGSATVAVVPFVGQAAFDRRLAACDLAFVRGEDSFVRAQWAAVPLVWHIYPQADDAHRVKLDAFLRRYAEGLAPGPAAALAACTRAFNEGSRTAVVRAWPALREALPALRTHAGHWARALGARPDLARSLVAFCRSKL